MTKTYNKSSYPAKIGCTSYVFPGDILFNVPKLAPVFHDIELVLFESSDVCNFPNTKEIEALRQLSLENDITYTIHLPTDKKAGAINKKEREGFVQQVKKLIELTQPLLPFAYILHLEGIDRKSTSSDIDTWKQYSRETCEMIVNIDGLNPELVCIENLDYPIDWHVDIVKQFGFSYCLDFGHLFLYKEDWKNIAARFLPKTKVIHIHGVRDDKDHISLAKNDKTQLFDFVDLIFNTFSGVVTIETFCEQDTFESLDILQETQGYK